MYHILLLIIKYIIKDSLDSTREYKRISTRSTILLEILFLVLSARAFFVLPYLPPLLSHLPSVDSVVSGKK